MKLKEPINKNYCATVVILDKFVELPNCDNVKHAIIFGNSVIVGKNETKGVKGLFFPIETALSNSFMEENNLHKDGALNRVPEEKGYFETTGRIKAVKFRGHKSEGFFIPLTSLKAFADIKELASLNEGAEFDHINGVEICHKYVIKNSQTQGSGKVKQAVKRISRLVPDQVRLHVDTENLRKNIFKLKPDDYVGDSNKVHGTSWVVGRLATYKKLKWYQKAFRWLGADIITKEYSMVYASRKVVKNEYDTKNHKHYYSYDLWEDIKNAVEFAVQQGITLYGECVGFLNDGGYIQKKYDYGCKPKEFKLFVYRVTYTSLEGKVFEFSIPQVKAYCEKYGLTYVPEFYYGKAKDMFPLPVGDNWNDQFLQMYEESSKLDDDCDICKNKVPKEGRVLRIDKPLAFEAYKLKSFRFLEAETKALDAGEVDLESSQSEENGN